MQNARKLLSRKVRAIKKMCCKTFVIGLNLNRKKINQVFIIKKTIELNLVGDG